MPPAASRRATLTLEGVSAGRNGRLVLDSVSVVVSPTTRLGVVGSNGSGKSTLLAVLAGLLDPTAGTVRLDPPSATVGLLAQEHDAAPGETVAEHLGRGLGVAAATLELEQAAAGLSDTRAAGTASARYEAALERYLSLGVADFEPRLLAALDELGLGSARHGQDVSTLSGGQRARLALAGVVLSRFDITLLDEPTNDLDFEGLALLEALVEQSAGGLVVVSHDRAFLERCVSEVLEIDEHDHRSRLYRGGWAGYLEERATSRAHAAEDFAVFETRRSELVERARKEREWATQGARREKRAGQDHDKAQRGFRLNRTEKLASRARRTERALDSLERVEKPFEGWQLRYSIGEAERAGTVVARLDGAVIARGELELGPLEIELAWGERVALTGPNGSGKSTLVEALLGRLPLLDGSRYLAPSVVVGELTQSRRHTSDGPGAARSVLDELAAATGLAQSEARSLLAKFGLGAPEVTRPAASLSAGQRTRAELARFQALGVNFLVLDEPSNHLDLPAIEQLERAVGDFEGTLLLVSHDRRLLEAVELTREVELAGLLRSELGSSANVASTAARAARGRARRARRGEA